MPLIRKTSGDATPSGMNGDATAVGLLVAGTVDDRWQAARRLADDPAGVDPLSAALAVETEPRVREAILTSLVRHGGDAAVRAILPYIRSDDASVRTGALDAVGALPQALAPHMAGLLADPDPDVRLLSCDLARALEPVEASRLLCDLLARETEVNVCAAAVDALAEVGGPDALTAMARCADRFPDEPFLGFAIKVAMERIRAGAPA